MNDQDYILFEDYISENLSGEEKSSFENRLLNETDFSQAFQTYKELNGYLEQQFKNEEETAAFKNNLEKISTNYFNQQKPAKKVIRLKPWQYAMAASIALLIGIYSYNLFSIPSYGDFASHNAISLTVRGAQSDLLNQAEKDFNSKDFKNAAVHFTELLNAEPENQEFQLYKAISGIELDQFEEADTLLTKISNGNSAYKYQATWYLALSKLKQKDFESCAQILKTIPEDADTYKTAQKLLRKL